MGRSVKFSFICVLLCMAILLSGCLAVPAAETVSSSPEETPVPGPVQYRLFSRSQSIEGTGDFRVMCASDGEYYGTVTEKIGENIPESVIKAAEKNEEEVTNDGRYDVFRTYLCCVAKDDRLIRISGYQEPESAENVSEWRNFSSVSGIAGIAKINDHLLLTLEYRSSSGITTGGNGGAVFQYQTEWFLRTIGIRSGHEFSRVRIDNPEGLYFSGKGMMLAADGSVLMTATGKNGDLACYVSRSGEILSEIEYGGSISGCIFLNNGYFAVVGERNGIRYVSVPDFGQQLFGDYAQLPPDARSCFSGSGEYAFFYDDGVSVYGCILATGVYAKIFSWSGMQTDRRSILSDVSITLTEGKKAEFLAAGSEPEEEICRITFLEYPQASAQEDDEEGKEGEEAEALPPEESPAPAPERLCLLSAAPTQALTEAVSDYNAGTDEYVIEIIDCSEYTRQYGAERGLTEYISAQMYGTFPDILDLSSLSWKVFAEAGWLEDLYPFLDTDEELSRKDYFPNVLAACEYNGALCTTCAGFYIETMAGAENIFGGKDSIGYAEIREICASRPGCEIFDAYTTASDVFRRCLKTDMDLYAEQGSGKCSIGSADFISLLEFAASFPLNYNYDSHVWDDLSDNSDLRARDGRQLLTRFTVYSMTDLMRVGYEFGGDAVMIGYPTVSGTGNALRTASFGESGTLAMCSMSGKKEAAWTFLRKFFTEEYQEDFWYIPSNRNVFERQLEEAKHAVYYLDKYGKPVIGKKTKKPVEVPKGSMYLSDFSEIKYYAVTEKRENEIRRLTEGTGKTLCEDQVLMSILCSCADEYFAGRISLDSAAGTMADYTQKYLESLRIPPPDIPEKP